MRKRSFLVLFCVFAGGLARAQVGEFSFSGGASRMRNASLGSLAPGLPESELTNGFRLALRFTLNPYRFFGHEFGYAYSHSRVTVPGSEDVSVPIHQGFYNFLFYAVPEGSKIRPFLTGGVQFSSFFPPGTSVYYGNQVTKFGVNYGGGLKIRLTSVWGIRFDLRQYNMGKPDMLQTPTAPSGRLYQNEISGGLSFNF